MPKPEENCKSRESSQGHVSSRQRSHSVCLPEDGAHVSEVSLVGYWSCERHMRQILSFKTVQLHCSRQLRRSSSRNPGQWIDIDHDGVDEVALPTDVTAQDCRHMGRIQLVLGGQGIWGIVMAEYREPVKVLGYTVERPLY
jgi:hypothetical protein